MKIEYHKYFRNKVKRLEKFALENYIFCHHENFNKLWELHQLSKQFKYIDNTTKIIFIRNRIPRTLIKSEIEPRVALFTLGGGYYSPGTENLKRFLDNLPKKLYYSDSQPSSWDWHDDIIIKL